ncbi:uncharacterized protein ACNLHF_025605 isoform 2-T2 [Anomaloglossus baeobatrachus]
MEKIFSLNLEIIFHLTGEDYTVVKTSSDRCQAPVCEGRGGTLSPISGPPPHPRIHEDINDQKILELTHKMLELLTGEVPIRCQDVTVYFSMEEWEYLEGHKEQYKEVMMEEPQPRTSPGLSSTRTTPERCPAPPPPPQDPQMIKDKYNIMEKILHLSLDIIFHLTGEDYTVVKTSSGRCQAPVCEGRAGTLSPIPGPPPHPRIHEDINDQKTLELTNKMLELLTGEVPIRCQDVTVYFSMEEWEYLEGHKERYKEVMMEEPQPRTSPGVSSTRTTPERCPAPPPPPQDPQLNKDKDQIMEKILNLSLEIIFHLTGEDYTVVKTSSDRCQAPVSEGRRGTLSPIPGPPPHPQIHEDINDQKILELTNKMLEMLTGEVPIRCQDVTVYFSMEEWEYLEGHKDRYKEVMIEEKQPRTSPDLASTRTTPERCPAPPPPPQDPQDKDNIMEKILHLSLEIIFHLTGEDYTVVKTSSDRCQAPVIEGRGGTLSPIPGPPPHPRIHEDINDQKILELANKMLELLTGEIPIRCQDVTVYFSMEEWEYLEGRKERYKEVMMEEPQPRTSPGLSSTRTTPERCPAPPPRDPQFLDPDKDLNNINSPERNVRGDQRSKEEIPTDHRPEDCGIIQNTYEEQVIVPDLPSVLHTQDPSSAASKQCLDSLQNVQQNKSHRRGVKQQRAQTGEKLYSCNQCRKCFTQKSALISHKIIHKGKPFSCPECGKCFSVKSQLEVHLKSHTGEKPFSCSECGKCFRSKSSLNMHIKIHTGEKPFSCSECGKCFIWKSQLDGHIKFHTGDKPFSCLECGKCFIKKSQLDKHIKTHTGEKPFSCSECGRCFIWKSQLDSHKKTHTGEKPFSCSECGKCFSSKSSLNMHIKIHTGEKLFSCSECGKCFMWKSQFHDHKKTHMGDKPFSCSECGKCFSWKSQLDSHIKSHTGEKPFSCSECGKCFSSKSYLNMHIKIHTGEKPFSCSECGKCFRWKSQLDSHIKSHTGEKPFSCSECGKCFNLKSSLNMHIKIHTGEKLFSCSECGKCFSLKSSLNMHIKIHTGEKLFSCSECGKCFSWKSQLDRHIKSHTGEKPFSCSECGKCFSSKSSLNMHIKTHTGEKLFSCSECGKCFIRKSDLNQHIKSHTGEKPFSCFECGKCCRLKSHLYDHIKIHTGEKPFSCPECAKCFIQKSQLAMHIKTHTGEKPFSCSECGKCFACRFTLVTHMKIHTRVKDMFV